MGFVEYLRVRKALTIFAIALLVVASFITFSAWYGINHGHHAFGAHGESYSIAVGSGKDAEENGGPDLPGGAHSLAELNFQIPIDWLFALAGFLSILMATIIGASLSKENGRNGFAFTKPISRERLALTFIAIDVAAIFASFVVTVAIVFLMLAMLGIAGKVSGDARSVAFAFDGLGAALMWYGLLQLATATRSSGAGLFIGLSWPVFFLTLLLFNVTEFGSIFHAAIAAIDFFNPLAYFEFSSHNQDVTTYSLFGFNEATCIAITWTTAVLACAGALLSWKRMEA